MIRVEKGTFDYSGTSVFEDIDLHLNRGEILCLFGPNGCGKTTLIDSILGHHRLRSGKIIVDGRDQCEYSSRELARRIAYVPQNHEKTFPYSVMEVVVMGRTPHCNGLTSPGKEDYKIADRALEMAGVSHLRERIYTKISGGETQLVILARALAQEAPVIIMDEPASHLDFRHELVLLETVADLVKEKGLSIIMSTHSPNHAFYFENRGIPARVALMNDKKFVATGAPAEVLSEKIMREIFGIDSKLVSEKISDGVSGTFMLPYRVIR
ncbi:MAG TPA: ABC transporter ATP-binding protein [Spirochaetota bacterium]|nr:ABC transporter ATP-binding protein [Spirochaetota bacterium]